MLTVNKREEKEKNFVALSSVYAAIFLTSFKLLVGTFTGSLGILSEALHSGLDLIAALMTFFAVKIADKPADSDHHYGHGKIENLSALVETFLLLITCIWIVYEAVDRIASGRSHMIVSVFSYIVVVTSILIDITRSRALMKVAKKYNSQALEADALHFSTDIFSSAVVLVGLIGAQFGYFLADSVAALIVAVIVFLVTVRLGKRSIDALLDRTPNFVDTEELRLIASEVDGVLKVHNIKVRSAGADVFVNLNIHVDPGITIREAHEISHIVENKIQERIPRCIIHVHSEPDHSANASVL